MCRFFFLHSYEHWQPTNQPDNQPINQPTNQSINQPTHQQTKQPTNNQSGRKNEARTKTESEQSSALLPTPVSVRSTKIRLKTNYLLHGQALSKLNFERK